MAPGDTEEVGVRLRVKDQRRFNAAMKEAAASVEGVGGSARKSKGWLNEFDKSTKLGGLAIASQRLDKLGGQMRSTGRTMTTHMTAPILLLGGAAVKSAIDYETAFAGVRKTINGTEAEFEMLSSGIRNMAKEIPVSTTELSAIAEAAGQLGIKKTAILGFTRTMADLGVATNMSSEQAADQLARLANITQMPQKNFDRLGSTIVQLGNKLAATESEITEMGMRIAGAGNTVGLSEHQILALAGTLTSVGINAEAGGTAISQTMLKMMSATRAGGDELQGFAKIAGVTTGEFKKQFETDATGAIITFLDGIRRMNKNGKDVSGALQGVGLSGIRVTDMLLRSAGAGDLMNKALGIGKNAWKNNNALQNEAQRRYKTTASQLTIMKNRLKDVGITVGSELLPPLNKVVKFLSRAFGGAVEKFGKLPKGVKTAAVAFVGLAAAIGPITWLIGGMLSGFGKAGKAIVWVASTMKKLRGLCILTRLQLIALKVQTLAVRAAMIVWRGVMIATRVAMMAFRGALVAARTAMMLFNLMMMANPIVLVIVAIVALIAIFVLAYKKISWFRAGVDAAFNFIKSIVAGAVNFIKNHWRLIITILGGPLGAAVALVTKHWDSIKHAAGAALDWIKTAFHNFVGFITGLPGKIGNAAAGMFNGVKEAFKSAVNFIIDAWNGIEFHIGGTDLGPFGHLPDATLSTPDIPRLAEGGLIRTAGAALVGDAGPELLRMPRAARVDPLPRTPRTRSALGADTDLGDLALDATMEPRFHLYIDGREVAVAVKKHADDEAARR